MISVAIDGPSGAGKSSLAKRLAKDLGYVYVDTGAMYRSIGLYAVRAGVDPRDEAAVTALLPQIKLAIRLVDGAQHIYLNGEDVSDAIRAENIGMAASAVSAHPPVRAFLLDTQRGLAADQNILMDGRDIGTVVLPFPSSLSTPIVPPSRSTYFRTIDIPSPVPAILLFVVFCSRVNASKIFVI